MTAAATWVVWAGLADNAPAYTIIGVTLSFFGFLVRRWVGQMDNASKAAEDARKEERSRSDTEIAKLESRYATEIQALKNDQAATRVVISRMLSAFSDFEHMTPEKFAEFRTEALRVLFPSKAAE